MRNDATRYEKALWEELRGSRLGVKFIRQYSVGPFVVDFYCPTKRLAIELDGSVHKNDGMYDKWRTKYLMSYGIKVLRFWDKEVEDGLDIVLGRICQICS